MAHPRSLLTLVIGMVVLLALALSSNAPTPAAGAPALRAPGPLTNTATFTDVTTLVPGLPQVYNSSVAWGDFDNDGRLDFLFTGATSSNRVSRLYRNTGAGFVDASALVQGGLPQVSDSSVAWGDFDNDGRLD